MAQSDQRSIPNPEAQRLARAFMSAHAGAINEEIYCACGDEPFVKSDGRLSLDAKEPLDSRASRLVRFANAMMDLKETGTCGVAFLQDGLPLTGSEIYDIESNVQDNYQRAKETEWRLSIGEKPDGRPLNILEEDSLKDRLKAAEHSRDSLKVDKTRLLEMQRDLLDVLKSLGIETRVSHKRNDNDRGR